MSDLGTNFVGADRELKEFYDFIQLQKTQKTVSEFCSLNHIQWKYIPERAPHFGGLWESAVKSVKFHLKWVAGNSKLGLKRIV